MRKKIIGIFIVTLFIGLSLQTVSSIESDIKLQEDFYDRIIERLMEFGHFPSVSTCIIKDDEVVWSKGYGFRDIDNNSLTTDNTIYEIASIKKTITGTALMQLYENGFFDLDDDVNDFLSFNLRNPNYPDTPITFRMLLSHCSSLNYVGLEYYTDYSISWEDFDTWFPYPFIKNYLVPNGTIYNPEIWSTKYSPGEFCSYANINFVIIAHLVELISNQHFVEYCEENIFNPLEMYNTSFYIEDFNRDQIAIPYIWNDTTNKHDNALYNYPEWLFPGVFLPDAGLFTSVSDLSHFMIAHMNGGVWNGISILKEETVNEMHTIQPSSPKQIGFGLAWLFQRRDFYIGRINFIGSKFIYEGHEGDLFGYHTYMYKKISDDIAVIYLTNGYRSSGIRSWNSAALLAEILFLKAKQF